MHDKGISIAVIDMNNGAPNQGIRGILDILTKYEHDSGIKIRHTIFDLRAKHEVPALSYDIFISSGGPGSPLESDGEAWEADFFKLLDDLEDYNDKHQLKKHIFLICHSFQLACRKYKLGTVTRRQSTVFGTYPVNLTPQGTLDPIFSGLPNPFYAVDSRDWQVTDPQEDFNTENKRPILAMEKERKHIDLEPCMMAVRFTDEIIGTQFHPEADPAGMTAYLLEKDKKAEFIAAHGQNKYDTMLLNLNDPNKLMLTQRLVLPNFLDQAIHGSNGKTND